MLKLKIKDKEYNIKFGYGATLKSKLVSKMAKMGDLNTEDNEDFEKIENFLLFLPEMLLVGLQKFHKDEFGFDYLTGDGKTEMLEKVYDIIDDYCEEKDAMSLFIQLQEEMLQNGFLKNLFQEEVAKTEQVQKKAKVTKIAKTTKN